MSHNSSFDCSTIQPERESKELISMLKNIIAQQQNKILELETDLKKWEKKYKEEFFKESQHSNQQHLRKIEQLQHLIAVFTKELQLAQDKIQEKSSRSNSIHHEHPLKEGIRFIEKLCRDIQLKSREIGVKNILIEEQQETIKKLKQQMQGYMKEYAIAIKKAQDYEDKLLAEIQRQENIIKKLRH